MRGQSHQGLLLTRDSVPNVGRMSMIGEPNRRDSTTGRFEGLGSQNGVGMTLAKVLRAADSLVRTTTAGLELSTPERPLDEAGERRPIENTPAIDRAVSLELCPLQHLEATESRSVRLPMAPRAISRQP
jgi:hypothetical protein